MTSVIADIDAIVGGISSGIDIQQNDKIVDSILSELINSFVDVTPTSSSFDYKKYTESNNDCGLTTDILSQMLSGFIYVFSNDDDQDDLKTCFKDTDEFEQVICNLGTALVSKNQQQIIPAFQTLLGDLPEFCAMLAACPNDQADFVKVADWFNYWKGQVQDKGL